MSAFQSYGDDASARLSFQKGRFETDSKQIETAADRLPNVFDPKRGVSSAVEMLVESGLPGSPNGAHAANPKTLGIWKKLLAAHALGPLDDWVGEKISAPSTVGSIELADDPTWAAGCATWMIAESDRLFARETWLWRTARATAFVFAGKHEAGYAQLRDLLNSDQSGPICYLAISAFERDVGMDGSKTFARRGLDRLKLARFRNDCRALLDQRSLVGRELFALAGALRGLNSDEVETLCSSLSPDDAKCLRDAVTELRASRDAPLSKILPKVLDHCWETSLRAHVAAALRSSLD